MTDYYMKEHLEQESWKKGRQSRGRLVTNFVLSLLDIIWDGALRFFFQLIKVRYILGFDNV